MMMRSTVGQAALWSVHSTRWAQRKFAELISTCAWAFRRARTRPFRSATCWTNQGLLIRLMGFSFQVASAAFVDGDGSCSDCESANKWFQRCRWKSCSTHVGRDDNEDGPMMASFVSWARREQVLLHDLSALLQLKRTCKQKVDRG